MLQIYIDDSGKKDQSSVVVLAGYLSTSEKWKTFSLEWEAILKSHDLSSFRMAQAWRLHRKYHKAGPIQRGWLLVKLLDCIKKYAEHAFVVSIDIDAHAEMYQRWDELGDSFKHVDRTYFAAFCAMVSLVYKYNYLKRFDEKIELTFDEQGGESATFLLSSFEEFKNVASQYFPGVKVDTPTFKTDDELPPLQAADMLAWLVRRERYSLDKDAYSDLGSILLGEALSMGFTKNIIDRNEMADISERAPKIFADRLGMKLPDIQ